MYVFHVLVSRPNPRFVCQIPVIIFQSLRAFLQMALFLQLSHYLGTYL